MDRKIGLILGRFAPLHIGHEYLINYALNRCDLLLIFVGSANKAISINNPFSYKERELMLKTVFKDRVIVAPLNDLGVGNVPAWGNYLLSSALKYVPHVDLFFYGDETKCNLWFDDKTKKTLQLVPISREDVDIHGTNLRKFLLENDEESFKKYTSKELHYLYDSLRKRMIEIENNNKQE